MNKYHYYAGFVIAILALVLNSFLGVIALPIVGLIFFIDNLVRENRERRNGTVELKEVEENFTNRKTTEWIDYKTYMLSPKWIATRNLVRTREGNTCQQCKSKHKIEVHHITYKNFGEEELKDLVCVCKPCHDLIHKYHGKNAKYYPLLKL